MSPRPQRRSRRPGGAAERGAALLLAMLIVTLVSTLAGTMMWQQWRAVQVEAAERARTQAAWILTGAIDWARLILRSDAVPAIDHLGEPWALPLAEARLSSFLSVDREQAPDAGPEAFLSGRIVDAQSKYNLTNLVSGGEIVAVELATLQRLFEQIGVPATLATTIAVGLRDSVEGLQPPAPPASGASAPRVERREPNPNPPLRPQTLDQLRWFGVDAESLKLMQPHVGLLPAPTPINLNTASREVIAAVLGETASAEAQRLVQTRERAPFKSVAEVSTLLSGVTLDERRVGVASNFFEVLGRLRLDDRVLEERSLVSRVRREVTVLTRDRVNSVQ